MGKTKQLGCFFCRNNCFADKIIADSSNNYFYPFTRLKYTLYLFSKICVQTRNLFASWEQIPVQLILNKSYFDYTSSLLKQIIAAKKITNELSDSDRTSLILEYLNSSPLSLRFEMYFAVDETNQLQIRLNNSYLFSLLTNPQSAFSPKTIKNEFIKQYPKLVSNSVAIEHTSANPTGFLHLGHLRNAVVGNILASIFRLLEFKVTELYFVNDKGLQVHDFFVMFSNLKLHPISSKLSNELSMSTYYNEEVVNFLTKHQLNITTIDELVKCMIDKIKQDLNWLNVNFDLFQFETELYSSKIVDKILTNLRSKSLVYLKDGAEWLKLASLDNSNEDRVLIKTNKQPTYLLTDIAYHWQKSINFDRVINVWGSDHFEYSNWLQTSFNLVNNQLKLNLKPLTIVLLQMITLTDKNNKTAKLSKRKGVTVSLTQLKKLIDWRSLRYLLIKIPVGKHLNISTDYLNSKFSQRVDSINYLDYVYIRSISILKKVRTLNQDLKQINYEFNELERLIIRLLFHIYPVIIRSFSELEPWHIVSHLNIIARNFNKYYEKFRVINNDITNSKLDSIGISRVLLVRNIVAIIELFYQITKITKIKK